MDLENTIKAIRKVYGTLSGKTHDVILVYKGYEYGITKPWVVKVDCREQDAPTYMEAATSLLKELKKELVEKIVAMELQAADYKKALGTLDN